jgi:hypothetical protein
VAPGSQDRSLIGPLDLLYKFHDDPDLIHECMKAWFELADAVTAAQQQILTLDEVFFAEDICYNHGLLISPVMAGKPYLFSGKMLKPYPIEDSPARCFIMADGRNIKPLSALLFKTKI